MVTLLQNDDPYNSAVIVHLFIGRGKCMTSVLEGCRPVCVRSNGSNVPLGQPRRLIKFDNDGFSGKKFKVKVDINSMIYYIFLTKFDSDIIFVTCSKFL